MSSLDQMEWSCADNIFVFTLQDTLRVAIPQEVERVHRPMTGHVMASEVFLKFGV